MKWNCILPFYLFALPKFLSLMATLIELTLALICSHVKSSGDYHAAGTPDTAGGEGNGKAVKRALELDMGVFQISPIDKGGKLFRPSTTVANATGPELSPIAFAALHAWKTQGMHTISVGFARPSDLDEVVDAARMFADTTGKTDQLLKAAETKLNSIAEEKLGKEWYEKVSFRYVS